MRRKAFDIILASGGLVLATVLLVAGGLLLWGYQFANGSVNDQLASQKIFFPPAGSPALASNEIGPYLNRYAGKQLLTGAQAQAYADHFIAVHVAEAAGGQTYAQVSTAAQAQPNNATLAQQKTTLFQGETLRGLLLEAYAFSKLAQIALIASVSAFVLGAVMVLLSILGFWHLRRVSPSEEVFESTTLATAKHAMA